MRFLNLSFLGLALVTAATTAQAQQLPVAASLSEMAAGKRSAIFNPFDKLREQKVFFLPFDRLMYHKLKLLTTNF